ncbi:MAG: hypothetical protein HY663_06345 [Chloroflexi bacterium]|nr:hypothetical protein [Chloroflexota bacterium]
MPDTTTPEDILARTGVLVLVSRSPEAQFDLHAVGQDKQGRIIVKLPGAPEEPVWQTAELRSIVYVAPWIADRESRWSPIPESQTIQQHEIARKMAMDLIASLRKNAIAYQGLRRELREIWSALVISAGGQPRRDGRPFTDVDLVLLAAVSVFDLAMLVQTEKESDSSPKPALLNKTLPHIQFLKSRAPAIRESIRGCLEQCGIAPDFWKEIVVFGLLLHPTGIAWVPLPFTLGARGSGTELERAMEVAVGVPEVTYRIVGAVHRAHLRTQQFRRTAAKPGARPGTRHRKSAARLKFERYVRSLTDAGVTPQFVVDNAEAQRLYRDARKDSEALLTERIVRHVRQRSGKASSP